MQRLRFAELYFEAPQQRQPSRGDSGEVGGCDQGAPGLGVGAYHIQAGFALGLEESLHRSLDRENQKFLIRSHTHIQYCAVHIRWRKKGHIKGHKWPCFLIFQCVLT